MMIQDSYILTEKHDSTSESENRPSKTSKLSPTPEVNNQQREKKLKTNSYDASVPNGLICKPKLEANAQTQHHKTHQNTWSKRYIEFEISKEDEQSWERMYEELVSFVKEFGHARVPKYSLQIHLLEYGWVINVEIIKSI